MLHYLDNAATTPVRAEAAEAAVRAMTQGWGNPSSRYALGAEAARTLKDCRAETAAALGCLEEEVCFISCGSEGDNWSILGAAEAGKRRGRHIVTSAIEHAAVLESCRFLETLGYEVTYLKPDRAGRLSPEELSSALRPDTILVSLALVNNELGTLAPIREAARLIREKNCPALLHTDAVQGFLKVPFTPRELGADLVTVSGHKIHAPKGIGAQYIRKGLKFPPLIRGGGQEGGLRSGTEATAQIAAFAAAARAGRESLESDLAHMARLKEYTKSRLAAQVPGLTFLGEGEAPHILPVSLTGYKSEVVVRFLSDRGVCVSSGSACHKGKPSHVYAALGLPKKVLDGALRISFSYSTAQEDADALVLALAQAQKQLFPSLS